jgi:iron complex outermembrane receptor protein
VRFRGVEFDGRWNPFERFWLTFSGALTEVRYIDYKNGTPPPEWRFAGAPASLDFSGTKATGVSPLSFNIGFTYDQPLGAAFAGAGFDQPVTAYTYANAAWKDTTPFSTPWSLYKIDQRPYTLVNFGVGLRTDDDRYNVFFWVKNLFDERYRTNISVSTGGAPNTQTFGDPRWFGGTLRVRLE